MSTPDRLCLRFDPETMVVFQKSSAGKVLAITYQWWLDCETNQYTLEYWFGIHTEVDDRENFSPDRTWMETFDTEALLVDYLRTKFRDPLFSPEVQLW